MDVRCKEEKGNTDTKDEVAKTSTIVHNKGKMCSMPTSVPPNLNVTSDLKVGMNT